MLDLKELMELAANLRAFEPGAIIAGGAVRDVTCGAPVKDIDVFVQYADPSCYEGEKSAFAAFCEFVARYIGSTVKYRPSDPAYGDLLDLAQLLPITTTKHNKGLVFDIVAIQEDPISDVQRYDFGLSQMFVTEAGRFMTDAAVMDLAQNTITYTPVTLPDAHAIVRSKNRLERLRVKYPHHQFRNVEGLDFLPVGIDGDTLAASIEWQTMEDPYHRCTRFPEHFSKKEDI